MRLIGFGNSRPTLKVETLKSGTPQKNKQDMVAGVVEARKLEVSHHPTKQGNPNTNSSASIVGGSASSSPSPAPRKTIIKAAPKSPTTIRSSNSSVGSGTINTTTTNGSSGIGSISKNGHSNNGFMKSTVASESRDISSPGRTGSEDNSTTSTDREVALDKLKASLGRFVRSGNRRMLMKSLKESRALKSIPVDDIEANLVYPSTPEEMTALEKEKLVLPVALNGMLLGADGRASKFTHLLRLLCNRLSRSEIQMSSDELYEAVLVRLAHESSEQTAAQCLAVALETSELAVRVLERAAAANKPKATAPRPPSKLTLYAADGSAHCCVEQTHTVGLYRKSDAGRPWVAFTAVVRERVNLSTGKGVKYITVQVPDEKVHG